MVSSKEVARRAGVSQSTVSRVMNNPDSVKADKRLKVLAAMEELGYYPNLIARSLVTNTTRTIALVSGTLRNGFFVETADAIIHSNKQRGYKTITYFEDENEVPDFFDSIMGLKADGLLLSLIRMDDPLIDKIERSKLPCVYFNRRPREGGCYVVADNVRAAGMMASHLLELGHTKIAYLTGETTISTFYERKIGYVDTLRAAGISPPSEWMREIRTSDEEVAACTERLLCAADRPTAVFCATDTMALACLDTAIRMGFRVPEDVSVAGIDNIRLASHEAVQLTTIGYRGVNVGAVAADLLIDLIEQPETRSDESRQIVVAPELIARRTTAPPQR